MIEREVKAVAGDPEELRRRLVLAGARLTFAGVMTDRRFDRDGSLTAREEVLRIRTYAGRDGSHRAQLGWKGPVATEAGYKLRPEHEIETPDAAEAERLIGALGYQPIHVIDRYVEYYQVGLAVVRIEWYPRMDPLVEIEGSSEAIEGAVAASGIDRDRFTAESLIDFVARYQLRTGRPAAVSLAELGGESPAWPGR